MFLAMLMLSIQLYVTVRCRGFLPISYSLSHPVPEVTRAMAIVTDALVLIVTWMKTAKAWYTSRRIGTFKTSLSTLVLRDGKHLPSAAGVMIFITCLQALFISCEANTL